QPSIRQRLVHRVQVLALDVLDERQLEQLLPVGDIANHHWDLVQAGSLRRTPAPFAGDDAVRRSRATYEDRLNDAVRLDRVRQLLELGVIHLHARLQVVRRQQIDV